MRTTSSIKYDVLSVKFNKRDEYGYTSYIITIPMVKGISYCILTDKEE